jgi:hypothetical protein
VPCGRGPGIVGVAGVVWANVKEKELRRALCSALGLSKDIRGCKKTTCMVQRITDAAYKRVQYKVLRLEDDDNENDNGDRAVEKTRREAQCPFRLLNILLFCDKFANDMSRREPPARYLMRQCSIISGKMGSCPVLRLDISSST